MSQNKKIRFIAEMAWSHDGSYTQALQIMKNAKKSGADFIGIHMTSLDDYMSKFYLNTPGKLSSGRQNLNVFKYLKKININNNKWLDFSNECKKNKIKLCVMPNDLESLKFCIKFIKPQMYAVAAAVFIEHELVNLISKQNIETVIRIGGATLGEIDNIIQIFRRNKNNKFTLLHGFQNYPTKIEETNLNQINVLRKIFNCEVGVADHVDGSDEMAFIVPLLAISVGALLIEKHITLDRKNKSEDYEAAIEPKQFKKMVDLSKKINLALGNPKMTGLSKDALRYREVSRKKTVAKINIMAGERLKTSNFIFKRSDQGLNPDEIKYFINRKINSNVNKDMPILKKFFS
jgi:N,N'-diacetyllegionaminate synthase